MHLINKSMANPANYDSRGLISKSEDKQCSVIKLEHKEFHTMCAAKVYTVIDPDNEGYMKM